MIGQIIGAVGGLATSYLDGKAAVQKANAEIKLKQATGEMDWEQSAIEASKDSWKDELWTIVFVAILKDELWTIVFVAILCANFIPSWQDAMRVGFDNLSNCPMWVQWGMYASIAASFGIRTMKGLKK
jgi:hypothetical protein